MALTRKLNLGCGRDYRQDWENWDISDQVGLDLQIDIRTERFPVADETFTEIYCSGVLEQVESNAHLVHILNECHRTLINKGWLKLVVPNARYSIAFRDPHDVRQFTPETFEYFREGSQEFKLYGSVYGYKPWTGIMINTNDRGIMTVEMAKP